MDTVQIDYDNILLYYYLKNKKTGIVNRYYDGQFTLRQFLNGEKGTDSYVEKIKQLRTKEYHSKEYNDIKEDLPLFWIFGKSCSGYRRKTDVTTKYNIFSIDIDKQDNEELFKKYDIEMIKLELCNSIDSCFCSMLSAGGQGIVLYLMLDDVTFENEKQYFNYWREEFRKKGINIDTNTNDIITRARYISYDEHPWIKNEVIPFKLPEGFRLSFIQDEDKTLRDDSVTVNTIRDIQYLDSTRRYKYVHTLMTMFTPEKAVEITKQIYDIYYNGTSDKQEAYNHIEASAKQHKKRKYDDVWKELQLLGIVEPDESNEYLLDIELKEGEEGNQWLYDKRDDILSFMKSGINMIIAGTGTGKTEFWNQLADRNKGDLWNPFKDGKDVLVVEPFNSVVDGKYDKTKTDIAAGEGKYINNSSHYTATNPVKFTKWVNDGGFRQMDYLVIDESHKIGTEEYRAESWVEFVKAVKKYSETYPEAVIVLQTATPTNEEWFFDNIGREIRVHKDTHKKVSITYTTTQFLNKINKSNGDETYSYDIVQTIKYYVDLYIKDNRKVYIYWGDGSIKNMKDYQKAEEMLGEYKAAVYHKRNEGNEDLEYIKTKRNMGKYDILMGSCYFSVGCDLNDECKAAVIIVGNIPYHEDEQVIGRFRKSKDIVVNILLDSGSIQKVDTSKMLENEEYTAMVLNRSKNVRSRSVIHRYSKDENERAVAYIRCSKYYFSDIARKFKFYEDRGYEVNNKYEEDILKKKISDDDTVDMPVYNILSLIDGKWMQVVNIVENVNNTVKKAIKENKKTQKTSIQSIYWMLKNGNNINFDEYIKKTKTQVKLNEWLKAIRTIVAHYDLDTFLETVYEKNVWSMNHKKMKTLLSWKIKMENGEDDKVETQLIKMLCSKYDEEGCDADMIKVYIAVAYCYWCMFAQEGHDCIYDLSGRLSYPVFKAWRSRIYEILNVPADIRNYIINYMDTREIVHDEIYEFFKDVISFDTDDKEEIFELFKNHWLSTYSYKRFLEYNIKQIILGNKKVGEKNAVELDGVTYESVKAASEALGISRMTVYHRLKGD